MTKSLGPVQKHYQLVGLEGSYQVCEPWQEGRARANSAMVDMFSSHVNLSHAKQRQCTRQKSLGSVFLDRVSPKNKSKQAITEQPMGSYPYPG